MQLVALTLIAFLAHVAVPAQDRPPTRPDTSTIRYVVLDDWVRQYLAAEWDKHATDTVILERAYCVGYQQDAFADGWAWRVTQIAPADSVRDVTVHSIGSFVCPRGPRVSSLHVHPPQTCVSDDDCVPGGIYAYQCFGSDVDIRTTTRQGYPFTLVQCARDAVVAVWPSRP